MRIIPDAFVYEAGAKLGGRTTAGVGHASAKWKGELHSQLYVAKPRLKPELNGPGRMSQARSVFVSTALQLIEASIAKSSIAVATSANAVMSRPAGNWSGRGSGGSVMSVIHDLQYGQHVSRFGTDPERPS